MWTILCSKNHPAELGIQDICHLAGFHVYSLAKYNCMNQQGNATCADSTQITDVNICASVIVVNCPQHTHTIWIAAEHNIVNSENLPARGLQLVP
jgi:hypothetical protein